MPWKLTVNGIDHYLDESEVPERNPGEPGNEKDAWAALCDKLVSYPNRHHVGLKVEKVDSIPV